jgi:hypothetical protein
VGYELSSRHGLPAAIPNLHGLPENGSHLSKI